MLKIEPCTWTIPEMPSPEIRKEINEAFSGMLERYEGNLTNKVSIETLNQWAEKKWIERRPYGTRVHWQRWV